MAASGPGSSYAAVFPRLQRRSLIFISPITIVNCGGIYTFLLGQFAKDAPNLVFGSCLGRASEKKLEALLFLCYKRQDRLQLP